MKILELNKFYLVHDGSRRGHPGFLVWKDDQANLYLLIKFGSSKSDNNVQLKHPISSSVLQSFVYKRPFVGKRKDVGNEMKYDIRIHEDDLWIILEIPKNNPVFSKTLSRNDKRQYKYGIKKPSTK